MNAITFQILSDIRKITGNTLVKTLRYYDAALKDEPLPSSQQGKGLGGAEPAFVAYLDLAAQHAPHISKLPSHRLNALLVQRLESLKKGG